MIYLFIWLAVSGLMAGLYASTHGKNPQASILFGLQYAVGTAFAGFVLLLAFIFLAVHFGWS